MFTDLEWNKKIKNKKFFLLKMDVFGRIFDSLQFHVGYLLS